MVLEDDFKVETVEDHTRVVFDHEKAQKTLGASVFWVRPGLLILQSLDEFIEGWQVKRDGNRRGIVEVVL